MRKVFCDRCGDEPSVTWHVHVEVRTVTCGEWDLCVACKDDLERFVAGYAVVRPAGYAVVRPEGRDA